MASRGHDDDADVSVEALGIAGIATYRVHADVVELSAAAATCLGVQERTLARDAFLARIHPPDRAGVRAALDGADGSAQGVRVRRVDGRLAFLRHAVARVDGVVVGTFVDLTTLLPEASGVSFTGVGPLELESLLEGAPYPAFMKDVEGHFTFVNRAFREAVAAVTGAPHDVVGRTQSDFAEAYAGRVDARDEEVLRTGRAHLYDEVFEAPDGQRTYQLSLFPVFGRDDRIVGLGGVSMDVTQLRRTEAELSAANTLLTKWADAFRVAGVGLAVAEGEPPVLTDVNQTFAAKFRRTDRELVGTHVARWFVDEVRDEADAMLARAEASGHERFETKMRRANGDEFSALVDVTAMTGADGLVHRYITVLDITEQHERENALRIFREVIDHLPIGVFLARLEAPGDAGSFRFVHANQFAQARTRELGDLVGRRIAEVTPDITRSALGQLYLDALSTGETQRVQAMAYGDAVFDLRAARVDDDLIAIIYDEVSEREHLLEQLSRLNRELERSNAELEDFAGVASHDLKAPLRSIIAFADILRVELADAMTPEADEQIGFIVSSAERLKQLVTDLLDYARVGQRPRRYERVDLSEIVEQVRLDLSHTITESGAELVAPRLDVVLGDGPMLRQLFQNLIGNAIKFRRSESPRVEVSSSADEDHFAVRVKDNGIGVPPEQAERVFEAFRRLHTESEYPGTGIGLAVCKRIVHRHGGRIWIESEVGAGTCVHFTLDRRQV